MKKKSSQKLDIEPVVLIQNEDYTSEICSMLRDQKEKEGDVTLSLIGGELTAHSFILSLKSAVFRSVLENFPPGFRFHVSCPDVRIEIFRQILELVYEGETYIETSCLDEFKAVAKAYSISLRGTNMVKDELGDSEDDDAMGEPAVKRKRGRPRKSELQIVAPKEVEETVVYQEDTVGPVTRKKVIDFRALHYDIPLEEDQESDEDVKVFTIEDPGEDEFVGDEDVQQDLPKDDDSDTDYEPFCSPVPPQANEMEDQDTMDTMDMTDYIDDESSTPSDEEQTRDEEESGTEGEDGSIDGTGDKESSTAKKKKKTGKKKRSEHYEGEHRCPICKIEFETVVSLREHYNSFHKRDGKFFCTDCTYTATNMSALLVHRRRHTGERPFVCTFCGRGFGHSGTLSEHMNLHTGNKPYKCDTCGAAFTQRKKLHTHRCSSPSNVDPLDPLEPRYTCEECGRKFMNKKAIAHHRIYHMEREQKPKDILCDICGRGFSTKYLLKSHMATHSHRKTFVCNICGRGYFTKKALENHLANHSGDHLYPYQCSMCDRKFRDQSKLAYHEQSHSGTRSFPCYYCEESFRLKSQLENHVLLHTTDGTKYVCDCGKVFLNYKYLQKHRLVHARRKRCRYCRKAFETDDQLMSHEQLHETGALPVTKNNPVAKEVRNMLRIGCSHCDAKFRNEEEFAEHAVEHANEAYGVGREEGEIGYTVSGAVGEIVYYTEDGEVRSANEEWGYEVVMPQGMVQEEAHASNYS